MKTIIEPFRIKATEPIRFTTPAERARILAEARYNLFKVRADDVMVDLLTDSGTGAMSAAQWAAAVEADESYAGAAPFFRFEGTLRDLTGYRHVIPTHQGRAAERILFSLIGGPQRVFLSNGHFDTTRANIEATGARAIDLPIAAARDASSPHPFKGDIDVAALRHFSAHFELLGEEEGT